MKLVHRKYETQTEDLTLNGCFAMISCAMYDMDGVARSLGACALEYATRLHGQGQGGSPLSSKLVSVFIFMFIL